MARQIVIEFLGKDKSFGRTLNDVEGSTSSLGSKLAKFGKVAAAGLAVVGIAAAKFGKDAVSAASDAEQSVGATETVFEDFADTVIRTSDEAAKQYGLSANEYRENANLLGSLFKNQGVAMDDLAGKTEDMIGTASDLAATFGGTTKDAVEALGSAFKGEFDPLERYGISLKQSDINARLAAKGQDDLTGASLKQAQQVAATEIITKQAAQTQGAFAKESDTLAHKQQVLAAQFENVKVKVGNALLPVVSNFVGYLSDSVIPAIEGWWDSLAPARRVISNFAADMGEIIGLVRDQKWDQAWDKFHRAAVRVLRKTGRAAKRILVDEVGPQIYEALSTIEDRWDKKWASFYENPESTYGSIVKLTQRFGKDLGKETGHSGTVAKLEFLTKLNPIQAGAQKIANGLVHGFPKFLKGLPGAAQSIGVQTTAGFLNGLRFIAVKAGAMVAAARQRIIDLGKDAFSWLFSAGYNVVAGFTGGIKRAGSEAISAITSIVATVKSKAKGIAGAIPGFATGTNFAPGGLAWVGEHGPELVNLPRGSQVIDATRSASIARGAATPVASTSAAAMPTTVVQLVLPGGQVIEQLLIEHSRKKGRPIQVRTLGTT